MNFPNPPLPIGTKPIPEVWRCVNRSGTATAVGQVVQISATGEVDDNAYLGSSGMTGQFTKPTTALLHYGIYGICLEVASDNKECEVMVSGVVDSFVLMATGSAVAGITPLVAVNAQTYLDGVPATGEKIIGIALADLTTPTSATACKVFFDGIHGFGSVA
jgi:hypothetical protein